MGLVFLVKCLEVKVLGNKYRQMVFWHFLLTLLLLLRSIKMTWAASSR